MSENIPVFKNFINGKYVESRSNITFELISPVDETIYAKSPESNQQDIDEAFTVANDAFKIWKHSTPSERQQALLKIADKLESKADELVKAQCRSTGQLSHFIHSEEIATSIDQIRFFAGASRILEGRSSGEYVKGLNSVIRREPLGIVGQVAPWNYPLLMAIWKTIPAIAAGNATVLKPSDTTPESTLIFAEIAAEFLPKGLLNVVLGNANTGNLLVSHPSCSLVSITGSVEAGRSVAISAAQNLVRSHLELGGNGPVIVFDDVNNIEKAVEQIATAGFFNSGQDCTAASRVLVHEKIHDLFLEKLVKYTKNIEVGTPDNQNALYGALNNIDQLTRIEAVISRLKNHINIETGGKRINTSGFYFEPTILSSLKQDDEAVQSELFAPIITVQSFSDEEDAITKANDVVYGLASSIWTENHGRAIRVSNALNFGTVWINTHIPLTAEMPHGGFKQSGYGKDLSIYGFEEYTRIKHIMSALD